jgi:hypothetical protein
LRETGYSETIRQSPVFGLPRSVDRAYWIAL